MKFAKWLLSLSSLGLVFAPLNNVVKAEATDSKTILKELQEANQGVNSLAGHGEVSISVGDDTNKLVDGKANGDIKIQMEPFALQANIQADGVLEDFVAEDEAEEESEPMPLNFSGSVTILDNIIYFYDGSAWTVQDISDEIGEFETAYEQSKQEAETNTELIDQLNAELSEVTETDTEYIVSIKSDLDVDTLYDQLNETFDFDKIIQESIDQARQVQEEALTAEDEAQIKEVQEKAIKAGLAGIQESEARYDKESKMLKEMTLKFALSPEQIAEVVGTDLEEVGGISVNVEYHLVIDEYGQDVDIQVPADAPTFDQAEEEVTDTESTSSEESASSQAA